MTTGSPPAKPTTRGTSIVSVHYAAAGTCYTTTDPGHSEEIPEVGKCLVKTLPATIAASLSSVGASARQVMFLYQDVTVHTTLLLPVSLSLLRCLILPTRLAPLSLAVSRYTKLGLALLFSCLLKRLFRRCRPSLRLTFGLVRGRRRLIMPNCRSRVRRRNRRPLPYRRPMRPTDLPRRGARDETVS